MPRVTLSTVDCRQALMRNMDGQGRRHGTRQDQDRLRGRLCRRSNPAGRGDRRTRRTRLSRHGMSGRTHHRARDTRSGQGSRQGLHAGAAGTHGGDHAAGAAAWRQDRHQYGRGQSDGRGARDPQACVRLGLPRLYVRRGDRRRGHRHHARASRTAADGGRRAAGVAVAAHGVGQCVSWRGCGGAGLRHRRRSGHHRARRRSGAVPRPDAARIRLVVR